MALGWRLTVVHRCRWEIHDRAHGRLSYLLFDTVRPVRSPHGRSALSFLILLLRVRASSCASRQPSSSMRSDSHSLVDRRAIYYDDKTNWHVDRLVFGQSCLMQPMLMQRCGNR
ncbi:hypothetical protein AcW1_008882 [Taiwanofungus camphoratus]|nr:hypothetical protein AcV5_006912 [Antrodia cinnamomea]KAI0949200.1 hypothetical protein AcW1_008882 [Antrodia cinnamomea]